MKRPAFYLLACLVFGAKFSAENWPGWRGPHGDGTSEEKDVPLEWSTTKNIRWKTPIPGIGHSSPIVYGDRVFVTTCVDRKAAGKDEGDRVLLAIDRRNGKILWERTVVKTRLERKHPLNSFASATPATDGKLVFVAFLDYPKMMIAAYDYDGTEVWRQSPGSLKSVHGFCTSPVLHRNLVILNGDQDDPSSYLVALDKQTGKEVWHVDRPNHIRSYCTPILIHTPEEPQVTQLVLSGSKTVTGYDADTGKLLWIHDGPTEQYVASLVYQDDILCLSTGFPEWHLMGLSPHGHGNITKTASVVWHIPHDRKLRRPERGVRAVTDCGRAHVLHHRRRGHVERRRYQDGQQAVPGETGEALRASPVRVGGHCSSSTMTAPAGS